MSLVPLLIFTYRLWCHTGSYEKVCRLAHQGRADQCLDQPYHTGDLSSTTVGALEAVGKGGADLGCLLELIGMVHHSDLFFGEILVDTHDELVDCSFGVFKTTFPCEPPW